MNFKVYFFLFLFVLGFGSAQAVFAGTPPGPLPFSIPHPSLTPPHTTTPMPLPGILSNPLLPHVEERNTCDPDFYEVMKNRAWMEAQRELTQNANLITRPDSVLTVSCFGEFLDHLGAYAGYTSLFGSAGHFPGNPDESLDSTIISIFLDIAMTTDYELEFLILDDPYLSNGFFLYGALELLVLDQLEDDVTLLGLAFDIADNPAMALCANYYIDDNFPGIMLEDRAKQEGGPPAWTRIDAELGDSVSRSGHTYNCQEMNQVWRRARCYDFATESLLDVSPPTSGTPQIRFHDAFYTLETYRDNAAAGRDFRTNGFGSVCEPPNGSMFPPLDAQTIACTLAVHGTNIILPTVTPLIGTGLPPPAIPVVILFPSAGPTWANAYTGSDPAPGAAGAASPYQTMVDMLIGSTVPEPTPPSPPSPLPGGSVPPTISPATCAPPIQTGVLVVAGTRRYIDAVCPTPGCWFEPPSSISGLGTCNN